MLRPNSLFARFLELPVMRYFGRLSYSIYLWQQLFFVGHFGGPVPGWGVFQRWPLSLLMTIGCAILSYYVIERPAIRAGHNIVAKLRSRKHTQRVLESKLRPVSNL
jgi:peptidoglycan/LPS O-acetylase OafA/YrhL